MSQRENDSDKVVAACTNDILIVFEQREASIAEMIAVCRIVGDLVSGRVVDHIKQSRKKGAAE